MEPSSKLPGVTLKRFQEALLAAFPSRDDLARMVRVGLDENLEAVAAPENLRVTVFQLLIWAEAQGRIPALIAGARKENPGNPALRAFAEEYAGERAPALFHVPFLPNPAFVGRDDDLEALHQLLQGARAAGVRPAALTGMGGIGKTQLAVEYAYRYRDAYPGGVYWVNAAEPWQAEFARLAIEVGLGAGDAPESERRLRLALAFAKHLGERPEALVVFDNVEDPLALRSPGAGFVPEQLGCRLLFTTRRRDPDSPFQTVDVRVLPEDVALRLLLSGGTRRVLLEAGPAADVDTARTICASLGCLPLALVLAAAFLARYPRITLGEYLARIRREGALVTADAADVDPRRLGTLHDAAVGATLRTQWDALASEDAKLVLKATALLDEAAFVPRARLALLTGLADAADPGYPARLEDALHELRGLSLVEELTEHAIRLHPLVRDFAERQIEARDAFAAACAVRLGEALWDMGRLHEEVAARGVDAVLGDLRVGMRLAGASGQVRLEALIRPLDRDAHYVCLWDAEKEPGFFLQQLHNRCLEMCISELREQTEAKLEELTWCWLRERFPTSREPEALIRTLGGHTHSVSGVVLTSDGRFAVSASEDKTLKVWDLTTGHPIRTFKGHTGGVSGVALTSDDHFAVSASKDKTLKVWDVTTGQAVRTLERHTDVVTSVALTSDDRFAISVCSDMTLKVWDLATGQAIHTLEGHTGRVTGVALTADGRFAVSASWDRTLKVWDLATGQAVRTIDSGWVTHVTLTGYFAFSILVNGPIKVWDIETGRVVRTMGNPASSVANMAIMPGGHLAISADRKDRVLRVWEVKTGRTIRTIETDTSPKMRSMAVARGGRFAVSCEGNWVQLWDIGTVYPVRAFKGYASALRGVAVASDGRLAVTASRDMTLKVWNLETGELTRTLTGHTGGVKDVALRSDDCFAVSASLDGTLKVWDLKMGQLVRTLEGHANSVCQVVLMPDSRFAVSVSLDNMLKVWDLDMGQVVHTFGTFDGVGAVGKHLAVTPDGRYALCACGDSIDVWDLATYQCVRVLKRHAGNVHGIVVTPNGKLVVSASMDKTLKVWDFETGQTVRTLEGHTDMVMGVALTSDGHFAVSVSEDRTLKVWDLTTGRPLATLRTHAPIHCCASTPDGRTILAGDDAGSLHILDWRNGGASRSR